MKIWLDAQLPESLAPWLALACGCEVTHVRSTALKHADDLTIFNAIRLPGSIFATKDEDFVDLVTRLDPPPQVLWIRLGNLTNRALRHGLSSSIAEALTLLRDGTPLVEVSPAR